MKKVLCVLLFHVFPLPSLIFTWPAGGNVPPSKIVPPGKFFVSKRERGPFAHAFDLPPPSILLQLRSWFWIIYNLSIDIKLEKIFLQNFVVRKSSQNSTMAISVRLPTGKGPYIEHYLIQVYEDGQFGLESSDNKFPTIPLLIAYYCQCWWVF